MLRNISSAICQYGLEAMAVDPAGLSPAELEAHALMADRLRALASSPSGNALAAARSSGSVTCCPPTSIEATAAAARSSGSATCCPPASNEATAATARSSGSVTCCPPASIEATAAAARSSGSVTCCPPASIEATAAAARSSGSVTCCPPASADSAPLAEWAAALTPSGLWPGLPLADALRRLLEFRRAFLATRVPAGTKKQWGAIDSAFRHYMAQTPTTAEEEALMRQIAVNRYHMGTAYRHPADLEADLARLNKEPETLKDRLYALALFFDSAMRSLCACFWTNRTHLVPCQC